MSINVQNSGLQISAGLPKQFPRKAIPQVAFSGRSNVGKSSLINTLLGRKSLARVSSAPGKTITINFYNVDEKLFLVDLPGYGFAKRPPAEKAAWSALTDGYFTNNPNIDLLKVVIQLIDARVGATKDDLMMLDWLIESEMPFLVVATKMDKLNKTEAAKVVESIRTQADIPDDVDIIPFSSETKEGKQTLWNRILDFCELV
ncbi:MAG: YihA family ribosome biogenesis GTP-binding protein [Clostridia bacterium]|nr:YihA family ribosome biogenesis GTP-binding protein [Clostridia bacterium]MBQ6614024.1 YihA family ribosome biogenesis GTP-binding protein [Clostridia bacterium]